MRTCFNRNPDSVLCLTLFCLQKHHNWSLIFMLTREKWSFGVESSAAASRHFREVRSRDAVVWSLKCRETAATVHTNRRGIERKLTKTLPYDQYIDKMSMVIALGAFKDHNKPRKPEWQRRYTSIYEVRSFEKVPGQNWPGTHRPIPRFQ